MLNCMSKMKMEQRTSKLLLWEPGWVAEVLRLTMLAPDIIEAVLDGRQPRHLNLQVLRGRHELLPRDWAEQRKLLGVTAG